MPVFFIWVRKLIFSERNRLRISENPKLCRKNPVSWYLNIKNSLRVSENQSKIWRMAGFASHRFWLPNRADVDTFVWVKVPAVRSATKSARHGQFQEKEKTQTLELTNFHSKKFRRKITSGKNGKTHSHWNLRNITEAFVVVVTKFPPVLASESFSQKSALPKTETKMVYFQFSAHFPPVGPET